MGFPKNKDSDLITKEFEINVEGPTFLSHVKSISKMKKGWVRKNRDVEADVCMMEPGI